MTPEQEAKLAALRQESVALDQSADALEERLLGNEARVSLWTELGDRHKHVTQLAVANTSGHLQAIERHYEHQIKKLQAMNSRAVPLATSPVSGKAQTKPAVKVATGRLASARNLVRAAPKRHN